MALGTRRDGNHHIDGITKLEPSHLIMMKALSNQSVKESKRIGKDSKCHSAKITEPETKNLLASRQAKRLELSFRIVKILCKLRTSLWLAFVETGCGSIPCSFVWQERQSSNRLSSLLLRFDKLG